MTGFGKKSFLIISALVLLIAFKRSNDLIYFGHGVTLFSQELNNVGPQSNWSVGQSKTLKVSHCLHRTNNDREPFKR